ncbi:MAG: hypothetical protein ACLFMR_07550 [Desulfohalobiaceae bacterium]
MHKLGIAALFTFLTLFLATQALSHTPLLDCWDNGDGTITCEGGFSDGGSAEGTAVYLQDAEGDKILQEKMDQDSQITFDQPDEDYTVVLDAGKGHQVKVKGDEIY